jgi:pyruvate formate lyase activating enzyme
MSPAASSAVAHASEQQATPVPVRGWTFDIQRYSLHDGPGIRTTVFLKGCPLRCTWCHNPESWSRGPEVRLAADRCIGCARCEAACPLGLARPGTLPEAVACTRCGRCVEACPTLARQLVGLSVSVADVFEVVERDRPFFVESGGGVTFSGGEPLAQPAFLLACLVEARSRGLRSAVDTSGFASSAVVRRVARWTDLFLYDIKTLDADLHRRVTGVPLRPIIDNLRLLDASGADIWLRVPLIPGINDDEPSLRAVGEFVRGLRSRRLHLLPFHRLGTEKHARLGREDPMLGLQSKLELQSTQPASVERAAALLAGYGLDVHIGG